MIEIKDLRVDFWLPGKRLQAVRGVSFEIGDDEIVGLVGESGSGKSVTAAALLQLHRPPQAAVSGSILTDGVESSSLKLSRLPAYRSEHFGYIAQEPSQSFDPLYTIERNFLEMFRIKNPKISKKEARMRAVALLNEVGIARPEERLRGFPHQFSGGMLRRIGIAQALLNDPEILILDEPTAGLDPRERVRFRNIISSLGKERTVVLSTHIVSDVDYIADQIMIMKHGEIAAEGTAQELTRAAGKIAWKCVAGEEEAERLGGSFTVSNIRHLENGVELRIVSDRRPAPDAEALEPTLEDIYLYLTGEKGRGAGDETV